MTNTPSTITSTDIALLMQEWDNQVAIAIAEGYSRAEAVVIVTAMFNKFFTK